MTLDADALYAAFAARDTRFDGVIYIGVTSTGIYCRPICPARTPRRANCLFFASAEAAEKAAFRPCLRCRPELAPGNAPVDDASRIASQLIHYIEEAMLDDGMGLEQIAAHFGLSARQLRRIVHKELGVAPVELLLTRRLLLAKQLLTETALPVIEVAYASGFASLRRFNDAFRARYGMPPTRLRAAARESDASLLRAETLTLRLSYRPPFDWEALLAFIGARALDGVEQVRDGVYQRTVRLGKSTGWMTVRHAPARHALLLELTHSLVPVLPVLLGRVRHLFDLNARPDIVAAHLSRDPLLAESIALRPGLRVPGAFDGFEVVARAILGQQVSVKAATTLAGRFARAFGEPIATPVPGLERLSPPPQRVAQATIEELTELGITRARANTLLALARAMAAGELKLGLGAHPDNAIQQMVAFPGIGPWTANYIAMRALRWSDAFPKEDLALRKQLGGCNPAQAESRSQPWRPWRSYAALHLWSMPPAQSSC